MQRWTAIRERYDPERGDEYVFCELEEDDDGDYVRFDDASAHIATLEAERAKWVEIHENHAAINARQAERIDALEVQLAAAQAEAKKWERSFEEGYAYYEQMKAERDEAMALLRQAQECFSITAPIAIKIDAALRRARRESDAD